MWKKNEPEADLYYNENLARLSEIAGRLAAEHGFVYAGLHPLMMKVMRDAKAVQIFDGSNQIQRMVVSKNIILD